MFSVMITFAEGIPDQRQARIGLEIRTMPGVLGVGRVSPGAKAPGLRRLWFAEMADERAAAALIERLRSNASVEAAEVPAERHLR